MLSCYQSMKQKLIFITKIYTNEQNIYFYAEDKNFNLKPSKNCISITLKCPFADVLMLKHELP